jgi:hypothetical protein
MGHIEDEAVDITALDQFSGGGIYELRVVFTLAGGWESEEATVEVVVMAGELYVAGMVQLTILV